ncbi:MAG: chromosomal replication initiator protein DnaA [Clostridia bacterium]|nr:chromosomal replication initiator protein DnaA [Clostridia bacterium]
MNTIEKIWSNILDRIAVLVSAPCYEIYFSRLKPVALKDDKLILMTEYSSVKNGIMKNLSAELNMAIRESMEKIEGVVIILKDELSSYVSSDEVPKKKEEFVPSIQKIVFQKNYTFDNFVIGDSNKYAAAAARAVAEAPGTSLNPLFIYGMPGLGKTHILHAIGNEILRNHPDMRVYYTTAENFTNDLIYSIRNSNNAELARQFREKYRNLDVLMIDDVQFLANKTSSQESLFHVFNDLYTAEKQIILSSDRPVKELTYIEDRLTSRFASGVVADIQPPSFETRVAILQKKAFHYKIDVTPEVINYIAEKEKYNIRLMEGMLKTVGYFASLNNRPADSIEFVMEALRDSSSNQSNEVNMNKIVEITCDYFGVKFADICGKKKTKELVEPRQLAMYLITVILPEIPLATIGQFFGGRDHTTVIHARDKLQQKIADDANAKKKAEDIKNLVYNR